MAADMGGTSDPYCVLELDNARVRSTHIRMICLHQRKPPKMVSFPSNQLNVHVYVSNFEVATHTEYKTLEPVWHRVFELQAFKSIDKGRTSDIQGVFLHWTSPKKSKYGKPRLGESTLT